MRFPLISFYPGCLVPAGLFICALTIVGCSTYTFGLFVVPVADSMDISRANINNAFITFLLGVGIISPFVGRLFDKFSARWIILAGGMSFSLGMMALSQLQAPALMLLVILGPISFGYTACGTLGANTVIVRWFQRRRGIALGTMAVATSAGGFLFAPFTATMIENFSWRQALLINGSVAGVAVIFMTTLLIRNSPSGTERGYSDEFSAQKDTAMPEENDENLPPAEPYDYRALLTSRNFWCLTLGIGLLYGSDQAMVTSNVPYFQDIGIDLKAAAFIISCTTVSAIAGKLFVGYLADKVDLRMVYHGVAIAHICLLLLYLMQPSYWVLLVFATLFGIAIGGVFPVWSTLLAWTYGARNFGTVMGAMTIIFKGISIVTVRFVGEVRDATGSYHMAFWVFIAMVVFGMILISLMRPNE